MAQESSPRSIVGWSQPEQEVGIAGIRTRTRNENEFVNRDHQDLPRVEALNEERKEASGTAKYALILAAAWTVAAGGSLMWNCIHERDGARQAAKTTAGAEFAKDVIYRRWNAGHGGVYVPISETTPPNTYLEVPERDIVTLSGQRLTLVNPAYMTRQVHELGWEAERVRGHITSLNPIRPANAPDEWEKRALESFDKGEKEFVSIETIEGGTFSRFMRPLVTEEGCLKCHAKQGYKKGDVRGGISVSVPMEPYMVIMRKQVTVLAFAHFGLWLFGTAMLVFGAKHIQHRVRQRDRAEEEMRENEVKHGAMVANISDVIGIIDVDGLMKYKSPNIEKLFGWKPEDLVGAHGWATVHPDDLARIQREFGLVLAGDGAPRTVEYRYKCKDGSYKPIELTAADLTKDPVIGGVLMNYRDITERKQHENVMRESEERFRTLYENAPVMINSFDENGRCILWNNQCRKAFGWSIDEINAQDDALSLFYPDPAVRDEVMRSIVNEPDEHFREWHPVAKDGMTLTTMWANFRLPGGTVISLGYDVTQLRSIEKEKLSLERQVHQAQRMESLGVLAGGVAHDFNNMLGIITGFAELTLEEVDSSSVAHGYVEQMQVAAARAAQTVEQILVFSRRTDAEKRVVSLVAIVEESVKLLRSILPASVVLRHEIFGEIPGVLADASQIQQVIMNLATNAHHAMWSEGGELSLLLTTHRVDAAATGGDLGIIEGDYAHLAVRDTGVGIPPEIRERIFEPFFTTKEVGKGSGMGLATSYGIVASHGGFMTVDSELGVGSVFHVYLPATTAEEKSDGGIAQDAGEKVQEKERVLVVDDEPAVLEMTSITLQMLGYSVTPFSDSCAALDALRQSPHSWDVLVTDQTMPGVDGIEMLKAARILRADLPVVIMTGHSDHVAQNVDGGVGADAVLKKPFLRLELARMLRQVLD